MISIVVPVYNEVENVRPLLSELVEVLPGLAREYEIIFVDDGSMDGTGAVLEQLKKERSCVRVLRMDRNRGQSAALSLGIASAAGDIVVTLDADLQNDPHDIPRLLAELEHVDFVCGWRVTRKDTTMKRCISRIANAVRRICVGDTVHDTGCTLKAFRRAAFMCIQPFRGYHRFLPALARIHGVSVSEVPVNHRPRTFGVSKYPFRRRWISPVIDLLGVMWLKKRHLKYTWEEI